MRLYGKKFARRSVEKRVKYRDETRDAILWDVDTSNKVGRVKIQGSNNLIIAHFPRNWKVTPYWLKPGCAVRILHRSGNRGWVEIIGEGRAIPQPVSGPALPPREGLFDAVITGAEVYETTPNSMGVIISNGTYRINDVVYYLAPETAGYVVMDDPAPMIMGSQTIMGIGETTVTIHAPPVSGEYRYDAIFVGEDGVLDYVSGETVSSDPVKPTLPDNHLLLGDYILIKGGKATVENSDIGADWLALKASSAILEAPDLTDDDFPWDAGDNTPETTVRLTVKDQYGVTLSTVTNYSATLELMRGKGHLWSATTGWNTVQVTQTFTDTYDFKYRRNQLDTETSVVIKATVTADFNLVATLLIKLYDAGGDLVDINYTE